MSRAAGAASERAGSGVDERTTTVGEVAAVLGARVVGDPSVEVRHLTHDSRRVGPGSMYCCVTGARHDGHEFAAAAVDAGAVALLVERELAVVGAAQVVVGDVRRALGPAAATVYGDPSAALDVVGVTGTNGKTTVVSLVAGVLAAAGRRSVAMGTLTGERTTPEAPDLQRQLAEHLADGATDVAMEVSSHALDQGRVDGVHFAVGVFTNLGLDHLDYHGTPERYFAAKARLFEPGRCRAGVVNADDVHGRLLLDVGGTDLHAVSLDELDGLTLGAAGSTFRWRDHEVTLPLPGRHNVTNALLAAETCRLLGVDDATVAAALSAAEVVPGRFERVVAGQPFTVAVDYAHTPDALTAVLTAARELAAGGRVLVVFGCGGDRDRSKRPEMGAVACDLADLAVLTTDNPRSEDPAAIAAEVVAGCPATATADGALVVEPDRAAAISHALSAARAGDVVVVAGKGHETTQVVGTTVTEFDDRLVVAAGLAALGWADGPGGEAVA